MANDSYPVSPRHSIHGIVFFVATWLILIYAGSSRMFRDPGTFWHLLTGQRIIQKGFPHEDWLTFTFQGKPWIAHQWMAECAMALLHQFGGYDALLVVASGGLALLFTWMFQRLVNAGVQMRWAVLFCALGFLTSAGSFHVRPLLLSMAFFASTIAWLVNVEAGRTEIKALCWLLPLFVLWVNCHGAVIGGMVTFGLAGALWLISWALGWSSPVRDRRDALVLATIIIASALTPLANPYGLEMARTWSIIIRSPAIAETIVEHAPVWRTKSWTVLPLAVIYLGLFLGAGRNRWRATSLLSLIWMALMFQKTRHAPLFGVAALVVLPELLQRNRVVARLARLNVHLCGTPPPASRFVLIRPLSIMVVLALVSVHTHMGRDDFSGPARGVWPYALKPQIQAWAREAGPSAPILNDMTLGGFLSHEITSIRIFGDDRCELYGDAFLSNWARGERDWYASWVAKHDIKVAVAERGSRLDDYLRATPAWREAAHTPTATLYVRSLATPFPQ